MKMSMNRFACVLAFAVIGFVGSGQVSAQDGGGGQPVQPPVQEPVQPPVNGDNSNVDTTNQAPIDFSEAAELDLGGDGIDRRNQGFIGATGERIIATNGFVGAPSETLGPVLDTASGATFGGGVNDQTQGSVLNPNTSGYQPAQNNGVLIERRGIRARLRPRFASPMISSARIADQFSSNIARQPSAVGLAGRFSISVENKTATIRGTVSTVQQAYQIEQQLRLQPGVYKIINQLQVMN